MANKHRRLVGAEEELRGPRRVGILRLKLTSRIAKRWGGLESQAQRLTVDVWEALMNPFISVAILIVAVALVAVTTVAVFRLVINKLGIKTLVDEGVLLTDVGIEFTRFPFMRRGKARFSEIESVKFVPFPRDLFLRLDYGPSVASGVTAGWLCFFKGTVVVKLVDTFLIRYHLFNPSNPAAFAKELQSRIERDRAAVSPAQSNNAGGPTLFKT